MAQRTEAIYNGKSIGIESIYTVIGDKQINIPEKLNWLREKSKKGELFCPCGCKRGDWLHFLHYYYRNTFR